jgi:hypothetical protein
MALRQIDLSQITAPASANAQVLAVINGNVTYTNVATVYTTVVASGETISSFLLMGA